MAAMTGVGASRERVSIDERPAVVEERSRIGDWEVDTMNGKPEGAVLAALVERYPRMSVLALAPNKTAEAVKAAILRAIRPLSSQGGIHLRMTTARSLRYTWTLPRRWRLTAFSLIPITVGSVA